MSSKLTHGAAEYVETIVQMPFTLELGKNWSAWQAYREFWSNAKDEQGCVGTKPARPMSGLTMIEVDCPALDEAHATRSEFILHGGNPQIPLWSGSGLEIYRGPSNVIYYQGLKVYTTDRPGTYTYNLTSETELTEDRTLANWWFTSRSIVRALMDAPSELLGTILLSGENCWEWNADWDCTYITPPPNFTACIQRLAQRHRHKLPQSLVTSALPKQLPPSVSLTKVELEMLRRGGEFCVKLGYPIEAPICVVESLGELILGSVHQPKSGDPIILLTKEAFRQGTKIVAGTLLEEHLHLTLGLRDHSRALQNHLLNMVISLGEELQGAPL